MRNIINLGVQKSRKIDSFYTGVGPQLSRLFSYLTLLVLAACDQGGVGVKGAKGDTPVKYVICGAAESNCFVAARFKDLDSCQSHKTWADMQCDTNSKANEMVCRKDTGPRIGFAYCTL